MKFRRLLEFRKQQEQQAKDVLSLRIAEFREELNRLQRLQDELLQLENMLLQEVKFPAALLRQYSCYLDRLQDRIEEQLEEVERSRDRVRKAREKWEGCRVEKEKMEKLVEKWEERQRERENILAQRFLDEMSIFRLAEGKES